MVRSMFARLVAITGALTGALAGTDIADAEVLIQTFKETQPKPEAAEPSKEQEGVPAASTACDEFAFQDALSYDMLAVVGHVPARVSCDPTDVAMLPSLLQLGVNFHINGIHVPPFFLVVAYGAASLIFIAVIFHAAVRIYADKGKVVSRYPEADAWRDNFFDWLWMGWATQWIAKWGTAGDSALTKIRASDIPLSDPEDEPPVNFAKFQKLWDEELERVGTENASLLKVVTRFVTYKKVFTMGAWNGLYEGFMFMGPPAAIKWMTRYLNWLYTQRGLGTEITPDMLVGPSMLLILIFTGLPLLMGLSDSMCTMLNGRIGIRIDGALSMAVYNKAQRLPVVQEEDDNYNIEKKMGGAKSTIGDATATEANPEDTEFKNTGPDDWELQSLRVMPKRFNLVQVVTNDINTNIMAIPNEIARMVVMVPVLFGTMVMLVQEVGWAFIFSVAMAFLNMGLMASVGLLMRYGIGTFYGTAGARLQFLQEVMNGIRFIKGSGAEQIIENRMTQCRRIEIASLESYYTIMCLMFVLSLQFPKLYILASLGGFAVFHNGQVEPTVIMSLIPLLFSVQGAIAVVFNLIPNLIMALPSCRRLEAFLKLAEAPRAMLNTEANPEACPPWVRLSPAIPSKLNPPVYRVCGSFTWFQTLDPALVDVDISIPQGKLVGVFGAVGSGKTTFLHAMMGELHAVGDSRIEVAERMSYAAQVPHLFEGTLKENILKDAEYHKERYDQAIYASCLDPDLEILPGGDAVPVGGRGISLSGGQKTRVSMARAAYDTSDLVLLDDPFAAVDSMTGRHIFENLLFGPLMRDRTRVVCSQPDNEKVLRYDWVIVIENGAITAQGPPAEVITCKQYKDLLSSHQFEDPMNAAGDEEEVVMPDNGRCAATKKLETLEAIELREEESENRASWQTIAFFGRMGGWCSILTCIVFYLAKNILDMRTQVQLSKWMSHGSQYEAGLIIEKPNPWHYIISYIVWMGISTVTFLISWIGGQAWTLNISQGCHDAMIKSLLHAPVDRFYDKTPPGRVMNRMANDMMNVDMQVYVGCCSTIGMVWSLSVPLYYVHLEMPLWFTLVTIPLYYLVITLITLYWRTMVPLRYLMQVSKSGVSSEIADVEINPASTRAYGMQEERLQQFGLAVRKMICADFLGGIICIRWLVNRLFVLGACFVTGLALLCIWRPGLLDVGSASLLINTVFGLIVSIEGNLHVGSMAQYQIIAMNRVYEYTSLPEEREDELPNDRAFKSFSVHVPRSIMGLIEYTKGQDGRVQVTPTGRRADVILEQLKNQPVLVAGPGKMLADLAPSSQLLRETDNWHRIVGINGNNTNVAEMAEDLCNGDSEQVLLHIMSGWLADGVKLEVKNLRVGYGNIPKDVLSGISFTVPRMTKCGIVGPTGCGKSTMLLALLRMLEPRDGRIYLEGVNIENLGLRTLRQSMGLVPQDPVLLQGSLRFNIDPFELYEDAHIWEGLKLVQMDEFVRAQCKGGLDYHVAGEGANLSFGQRQLLSLARNIVKKPMLLLLDECTSAIDPHTQELLQSTIEKAFPTSTMIVIAHRLETILNFDMVIVLFRGRVVEKGSIQDCARMKGGRFAKMLAARGLSVNIEK